MNIAAQGLFALTMAGMAALKAWMNPFNSAAVQLS